MHTSISSIILPYFTNQNQNQFSIVHTFYHKPFLHGILYHPLQELQSLSYSTYSYSYEDKVKYYIQDIEKRDGALDPNKMTEEEKAIVTSGLLNSYGPNQPEHWVQHWNPSSRRCLGGEMHAKWQLEHI